jgi:general stress protein 26
MTWIPEPVNRLLETALVGELTVAGSKGQPVTHPLIPLWDGRIVYMSSSVLFSRKLEHIKRHPRVSLAITDPVACGGLRERCAIQGTARVIEDDLHTTWMQLLPLWRKKEPAIDFFLGKRFALPLFFERSIIELTPERVMWWEGGDPAAEPMMAAAEGAAP